MRQTRCRDRVASKLSRVSVCPCLRVPAPGALTFGSRVHLYVKPSSSKKAVFTKKLVFGLGFWSGHAHGFPLACWHLSQPERLARTQVFLPITKC